MPEPTCPSMFKGALTPRKTAPRSSRSATQASARTTGPARRKLSSMPSGVGTSRSVSSMIEGTGAMRSTVTAVRSGVVDEDVAVTAIKGCEQCGDQHQPAEKEGNAGDNAEPDDNDPVDEKRDDVPERTLEALLHGVHGLQPMEHPKPRREPDRHADWDEQRRHDQHEQQDREPGHCRRTGEARSEQAHAEHQGGEQHDGKSERHVQ